MFKLINKIEFPTNSHENENKWTDQFDIAGN